MWVADRTVPHHRVYFFQQWQQPDWAVLSRAERTSFIEQDDARMHFPLLMEDGRQPALLRFSFFSRLCYQQPVAEWVCEAACDRYPQWRVMQSSLQITLQELMMNALIHSNLEMNARFDDMAGFNRYCDLLHSRVMNPLYALRRIDICLNQVGERVEVDVFSEGRALRMDGLSKSAEYGGRGLLLIEACGGRLQLREGKRHITASFQLPPVADHAMPSDVEYLHGRVSAAQGVRL